MANNYLRDVTVLVADNQEFVCSLVRVMLRPLGCTKVRDASSGEQAWEIFLSSPVDLIIADWYMKPMDGLELTRHIRNDKQSPNPYVPVIMISGFAEMARIVEARDAGINEFVVKPLAAKALFSRIQAVIEHPRQFVRTASFFGPDRRRKEQEVEDDRRGKKPDEKKPPADPKKEMKQDEVDAFLSPDSQPPEA
ncbi:MAG: response regulator [Rhodospirillaceae bacterium]